LAVRRNNANPTVSRGNGHQRDRHRSEDPLVAQGRRLLRTEGALADDPPWEAMMNPQVMMTALLPLQILHFQFNRLFFL
jgi:hypothetical protein